MEMYLYNCYIQSTHFAICGRCCNFLALCSFIDKIISCVYVQALSVYTDEDLVHLCKVLLHHSTAEPKRLLCTQKVFFNTYLPHFRYLRGC